jgi:hypothetical protein
MMSAMALGFSITKSVSPEGNGRLMIVRGGDRVVR